VAHSLPEALEMASGSPGSEEVFVIGGGEIYHQAIDQADRLYLTQVNAAADADTFFPEYSQYSKVVQEESQTSAEIPFRYIVLERP
jgi:dihydrofolate reductase